MYYGHYKKIIIKKLIKNIIGKNAVFCNKKRRAQHSKIAIHGRDGIGKSTITSNLAAILSEIYKVMQNYIDKISEN